jgi:quercetin dioxygenase-like cupin family protein
LGASKVNRVKVATLLGILASLLAVPITLSIANGQETSDAMHEHLAGVTCDTIPPGEKRPDFGCFNVASEGGLHFSTRQVYWHIRTFENRAAADAAKSATGIVIEEDGRVWLSEFGSRELIVRGGQPVAAVGPLHLPAAKSYTAVLSYAVMRPGDRARVHTHPGPEGWYMLAGEQCLETPSGASRAKTGGTMTVPPNVPMELSITGTEVRKSLVVVIHDSSQPQGIASQWRPSGACRQ